jgi:hypothetical protein
VRTEGAIERVHYPVTTSPDEWASELLALDQLLVEGLDAKSLKQKLKVLGQQPDPKLGSLKLSKAVLITLGFEDDDAGKLLQPLETLHLLRTKLKGHAVSVEEVNTIKEEALARYGTYATHFRILCAECDAALERVAEALTSG